MARKDIHAARRVLARNVRRLRLARDLSQEDLAHTAELDSQSMAELAAGTVRFLPADEASR